MKCQLDALSRDVARELTLGELLSRRWSIIRRRTTEITVLKRVDRFFDERNAKLLNAKNMVLRADFFCHSPPDVNLA